MPAAPINEVLKGQKALVTGGSSGIGKGASYFRPVTRKTACPFGFLKGTILKRSVVRLIIGREPIWANLWANLP